MDKAQTAEVKKKQEKTRLVREVKRRAMMHNSPSAKVMLAKVSLVTPSPSPLSIPTPDSTTLVCPNPRYPRLSRSACTDKLSLECLSNLRMVRARLSLSLAWQQCSCVCFSCKGCR